MNIKLWPQDPDCSCEECTCDQSSFGEKRECDCMKCDCEKCHQEEEGCLGCGSACADCEPQV